MASPTPRTPNDERPHHERPGDSPAPPLLRVATIGGGIGGGGGGKRQGSKSAKYSPRKTSSAEVNAAARLYDIMFLTKARVPGPVVSRRICRCCRCGGCESSAFNPGASRFISSQIAHGQTIALFAARRTQPQPSARAEKDFKRRLRASAAAASSCRCRWRINRQRVDRACTGRGDGVG